MRFKNMWVLLLVLQIVATPVRALAGDSFWWSVEVKLGHSADKIITVSHLLGDKKLKHYKLGEFRQLLKSGRFEFGIIPLTVTSTGLINDLDVCKDSLEPDQFNVDMALLVQYLQIPATFRNVRFEIVLVPANTRFKLKVSKKITDTITIRLAMPVPKSAEECLSWKTKVFEKYIHEFVHAYNVIIRFPQANEISNEVVAYSMTNCIALKHRPPAEVFPDWYQSTDKFHFNKEYADIVSGKVYKPASLAKEPTIIGNGITMLNFYHLYGNSYPASVSNAQRDAVESYCKYVGSTPHNFKKTSYFERSH